MRTRPDWRRDFGHPTANSRLFRGSRREPHGARRGPSRIWQPRLGRARTGSARRGRRRDLCTPREPKKDRCLRDLCTPREPKKDRCLKRIGRDQVWGVCNNHAARDHPHVVGREGVARPPPIKTPHGQRLQGPPLPGTARLGSCQIVLNTPVRDRVWVNSSVAAQDIKWPSRICPNSAASYGGWSWHMLFDEGTTPSSTLHGCIPAPMSSQFLT